MKLKLFLILLLSLMALSNGHVEAQPFEFSPSINTYAETKIVVSYAFTQNVTSEAYAAGKSVWQVNIGHLYTTFVTDAADKFSWKLTINYAVVVNQTVTIAVYSGDQPVNVYPFTVQTDQLVFQFAIVVTQQPRYPTSEEIAEKAVEVLQNQLSEYVAEMRSENELSRENIGTQWFIVITVFAGFVITTLLPYIKKPRREEK
jgi:hypothetical protein